MVRLISVLFVLALLGFSIPSSAQQARRVVLVIGNGQYANHPAMANPANDARLVSDAFRRIGATVTLQTDASRADFISRLRAFRSQADGAEFAAIYFSGHGLEVNGVNWVIPTDAKLADERDLEFEAINFNLLMQAIAGARMRMLVLDAARDNPFVRGVATRAAGGRGLAPVDADDMMIIYSASPGQLAMDGSGTNSPFAVAFANVIQRPGMEIRMMAGLLRDSVMQATNGMQKPFVSATLGGEAFYLVPATAAPAPNATPVAPIPPRFAYSQQPRLALVIGNGDYNGDRDVDDVDPRIAETAGLMTDLPNAVNDGRDVAAALHAVKFDVTHIENVDQGVLTDAVVAFARKVRQQGPTAIAVVFYSGHGMQVNGVNFLIPSGARLPAGDLTALTPAEMEATLRPRAYALNDLLGLLPQPVDEDGRTGVNVVVLDACRNNPWDSRLRGVARGSRGGGLTVTDLPQRLVGTLIAFSTSPGDFAADGTGTNSPYTAALKARIAQQNLPVLNLFNEVQRDVRTGTKGSQIPWSNSSGIGNVCLGPCVPL